MTAGASRQERIKLVRTELLHVWVLSSFAIAQPLFDRLAGREIFLARHEIGALAVLLVVPVLMLCVPFLLMLPMLLAALAGPRTFRHVGSGTLFALLLLLAMAVLLRISRGLHLGQSGIPEMLFLLPALALAVLFVWWYRRSTVPGRLLSVASVGLIVFPAVYLSSGTIRSILLPGRPATIEVRPALNAVPVVMVVFDEFCGTSLMDPEQEIDAARYPNFAALARTSTWYRNATTVHPRTDHALPAILTGRFPSGVKRPLEAEYPQNLFTLLDASRQYHLTVFEPYTRLCPVRLKRYDASEGPAAKAGALFRTLGPVYLNDVLPKELAFRPAIPREWYGLTEIEEVDALRSGLFQYPWNLDRDHQLDHFLSCVTRAERPTLHFLHLAVPHYPSCYLPSGRKYIPFVDGARPPLGARGPLGEDWGDDELATQHAWQRHLLQIGYADRLLGELLDRLKDVGLFDDCLLIVMADHGASFLPGQSRRYPTGSNLPDLLSIPLFIKLPGQQAGTIDDRNVELIDVLPTIVDVLKMELPAPVDGVSLLDPPTSARLRKTLVLDEREIVTEPEFKSRRDSLDRMLRTFGSGDEPGRLFRIGPHPELIGRRTDELHVAETADVHLELAHGVTFFDDTPEALSPCWFMGRVLAPEGPVELAVAVNGTIAAVTRTYRQPGLEDQWSVMLPESAFQTGENDVRFYAVEAQDSRGDLRLSNVRISRMKKQ